MSFSTLSNFFKYFKGRFLTKNKSRQRMNLAKKMQKQATFKFFKRSIVKTQNLFVLSLYLIYFKKGSKVLKEFCSRAVDHSLCLWYLVVFKNQIFITLNLMTKFFNFIKSVFLWDYVKDQFSIAKVAFRRFKMKKEANFGLSRYKKQIWINFEYFRWIKF